MTGRRADTAERVLGAGVDVEAILRTTVAALASEPDIVWAGISFLEGANLTAGPSAGVPDDTRRATVPIVVDGSFVGELAADGVVDVALLERVAALLAAYVLAGACD